MERTQHPAFLKTLEEARYSADRLQQLCQALRGSLELGNHHFARIGPPFNRPSVDLALLREAAVQMERASRLTADLGPALEEFCAGLSTLEREHTRLTTLYGISQTLNSTLDLEQLLNIVMDRIIDVMKAERGFLMLIDEQTQQLDFKVARNMGRETIAESSFQVSRGIIDKVAAEGVPVLTTNAQSDPRFSTQASVISYSLRSILCAPLIAKNSLIGIVYVDNRIRAGLFSQQDLDLLVAFTNQAVIAIENARLFESIVLNMNEIGKMKSQMDNIFSSITSGVVTISSDGEITAFNGAAEQIFELSANTVVGQPYRDVFRSLEHTPLPTLIEKVINTDRRYVGYEIQCDIGSRRSVFLTISLSTLRNTDNQTIGAAMVIEDMTETRKLLAEKTTIKDTFERVVAKAVVDRLLSSPPKLGGEKQIVTILFADIRGYTALAERMSPEELLATLNSYLALTAKAILKHEGTVDKFLGDGIMAFFNAPLVQPDHALRSARAALEMMQQLRQYRSTLGLGTTQIDFGIGINTGEVIAGNIGSQEFMNYTVIGDAVNISRRLQENARAGEILVSGSTYELIRGSAEVQSLKPMIVRGRSSPVSVYQLLGLSD